MIAVLNRSQPAAPVDSVAGVKGIVVAEAVALVVDGLAVLGRIYPAGGTP